ncbi:ABC transporter ATP-binding protein [soil metagenome]
MSGGASMIGASSASVPSPPLVVVRNLDKRFANGTVAISALNLSIEQGSFVSILGPSGCGKSTLLRLIAGIGKPSRGAIDWPSARHEARGAPERDIAFVFQEPTLMPWSKALNNVMLPLRVAGVSADKARALARDALARVGLSAFEKSYPRELSGGMKMRVSIARALVTKPRLLLLDEPFAALDEINRLKLNRDLLELWNEERFTAIFVTHSVLESVYLSQRIVVMAPSPGRAVADHRIDVPFEQRSGGYRTSVAYNECVRTVSLSLSAAMSNTTSNAMAHT